MNNRLYTRTDFISPKSTVLTVHSIFARTVNLISSLQEFVFLVTTSEQLTPQSLLIPAGKLKYIKLSDRVILSESATRLTSPWGESEIISSYDSAAAFQTETASELIPEFLKNNLKSIQKCLDSNCDRSPFLKDFSRRSEGEFIPILRLLSKKLKLSHNSGRKLDILKSCQNYLGAGIGLTPSFDDFLTGLLLADRIHANNDSSKELIRISTEKLERLKFRTTIISYQQLILAILGKSSLLIEDILYNCLYESIPTARFFKLFNYGSSSGTEILAGFWLYWHCLGLTE